MEKFCVLFSKELKEYDFGEGHPLSQRRGEEFLIFLKEKIKKDFPVLNAKEISDKDLELICEKDYIDFTKNFFSSSHLGKKYNGRFFKYHSGDNFPGKNPGNVERGARFIIGQAKLAGDLISQKKFKKVISLGGGLHHAKRNFGEGFCIYNDVAFCAKYLKEKNWFKKILILDTDAHAGNGTMEYFYEDETVLFIDIHQDPATLYPGTGFLWQMGKARGRGFTVNLPLAPFSGDESYELLFEKIVNPLVEEFEPELIIRNGGGDPHFADPLTQLGMTVNGFKMVGEKVRKLAEISEGRLIDLVVSGYNQEVLHWSWLGIISGIIGENLKLKDIPFPPDLEEKRKSAFFQTKELVKKASKILSPFWRCFR